MSHARKLLCFFLLMFLSSEILADNLTIKELLVSKSQWEETCIKIKDGFEGMAHKYGVFKDFKHPVNDHLLVSDLELAGLLIPIPKGSYESPLISVDGDSIFMKLIGLNDIVVVARIEDLQLFEDVWAKVDRESGKLIVSEEGAEYTSAIYGGPVSSEQLAIDSFLYTPSDLVCNSATKIQDIRTILALEGKPLRSVFSLSPMVVLLENKVLKSLVEFGETPGRLTLGIRSISEDKLRAVTYYFKKDQAELMYDIAAVFLKGNTDMLEASFD